MRTSDQCIVSPNQFLRSLSGEDRTLLAGKLSRSSVEPGNLLLDDIHPASAIYFPETVIVSIERQFGETQHVETAVVGYEGMIGWSALVGSGRSQERAVVQMRPGTVLGISISDISAACEASRTLQSAVMRFIEIMMTQMSQAIVSHARDSLDLRVCRWILMRHDRTPTDQIFIKHEEISRNLGSRRASVTDCLHLLEGRHLIRCYRGRILVRDRAALELHAGKSYGAAEMYYRTMIGPFGYGARTEPHSTLVRRQYSDAA